MVAFYQKYRPQKFAEVVGQDALVRVLVNASSSGKLSHAYLFTGSRGVGKTTLARLVAKAANCLKPKDGEPCTKCASCLAIVSGSFLDVIEIDAASHTGVDNVRDLIDKMQFKPLHGRMKVFIIDEVHMLSKAAFNALLKSLEEPPAHAMFILATTDIDKVPETIISRTQRLDFRRIPVAEIIKQLKTVVGSEKVSLPEGAVEAIAENAEGGMRDALSMLGTAASLGKGASMEDVRTLLGITPLGVVRKLLELIATHRSSEIPGFFDEQNSLGTDFLVFNRNILEYLRTLLVNGLSGKTAEDSEDIVMDLSKLLLIIRLFLRSYKEIGQAPSSDLPVLLAAIEASMSGAVQASANSGANTSINANAVVQPKTQPQQGGSVSQAAAELSLTQAEGSIAPTKTVDVTLQEVGGFWPTVLQKLKENNGSLATVLRNAKLHAVEHGRIVVSVQYQFHKENIENKRNLSVIQEIIREITGKNVTLKAIVMKPNAEEPVVDAVQALNEALNMFGGEVIEQ